MSRIWYLIPLAALFAGCESDDGRKAAARPDPEPKKADGKKVNVGKNVWLEVLPGGKRQVVVSAEVCLTGGPLELFLTRKGTKEHEAILAADVDARKVHEALLLAGAEKGEPVRFHPRFIPPTGTTVQVSVSYSAGGEAKTVRAQDWVRNLTTKAALQSDWVFAGSVLVDDALNPNAPKRYMANEGDLIAVSNFDTAMLDLPIESSKADDSRGYEAWTERLPPEGTRVAVTLTPVAGKK